MGVKKEITAYQINNVLRVYGERLRRGRISKRQRSTNTNGPDKISISVNARHETIIDGITSNIVERITHFEPHENVESEPVKPSALLLLLRPVGNLGREEFEHPPAGPFTRQEPLQ